MKLEDLSDAELAGLGIAQTSDYVLVIDADLRVRYCNRLLAGLTREMVNGSHALDFQPPDAHDMVRGKLVSVLETGEPTQYESEFAHPDGSKRYFESRVSLLKTEDGTRGLVIGTSDITSRKVELFDLEQFFALTDDLMAVLDQQGRFLRVNRAFQESLGYTAAELFMQPQSMCVHPDDRDAFQAVFGASEGERAPSFTYRALRADGSSVVLELKITTMQESGRTIGVARDITQARSLERQLLRSQKMDAIGQLAGGIAHDFNNLLTSVIANAQLALDELPAEHGVRELLDSVLHAGNLSADLTKQLLAMSRRDETVRTEVDLNRLIRQLLTMLRRTIPETVEIDFIPGHQLPKVRADRSQLEQVLLNLSLNARDAMPGGGRLTISAETVLINGEYRRAHPWARPGRYVLLQVTDTGIGIPAEIQERIFDPFFTTKPAGHGTGLGMTIAYEVVQRHDGMMHVYSESGRGTTIKVYLPAAVAAAGSIAGRPKGAVPQGAERVLLAEDEPLVRAVVERILRRGGYEVTSTSNGTEALALLESGAEFDLVMMDVVMPEMGGADVARVLRERGSTLPILLSSGYSQGALGAPEIEGIPLLVKPFDPDSLLRIVRKLLDEGPSS